VQLTASQESFGFMEEVNSVRRSIFHIAKKSWGKKDAAVTQPTLCVLVVLHNPNKE
jgi:hypothetical protein